MVRQKYFKGGGGANVVWDEQKYKLSNNLENLRRTKLLLGDLFNKISYKLFIKFINC